MTSPPHTSETPEARRAAAAGSATIASATQHRRDGGAHRPRAHADAGRARRGSSHRIGAATIAVAPRASAAHPEAVQRVSAEQRERRAEQSREQVVEAQQPAALGGARAIDELRGRRDEGHVPADAETEQERGGGDDALPPTAARPSRRPSRPAPPRAPASDRSGR